MKNNIAKYLKISEEARQRCNQIINTSVSNCINTIQDFVDDNQIKEYGFYSMGSHAISSMIIKTQEEIISDLDLALYLDDSLCLSFSNNDKYNLEIKLKEVSQIKIEFYIYTKSKLTKYMQAGVFGTYRNQYLAGKRISFSRSKKPTLKLQLYSNFLLLTTPYNMNYTTTYRGNLKFLKRLIEQVCFSHWPITTDYVKLLELEPFRVLYKEKALLKKKKNQK